MDDRLAVLEARLRELEEDREIRELLARYGYYADAPLDEEYFRLFTEDCVMDVSVGCGENPYEVVRWEGLAEMRRFLGERTSQHDNGFQGRSFHVQGNNLAIKITGDDAVATGYSFILHQDGPTLRLLSASINEWAFRRDDGHWKIQMRKRRMAGAPDAKEVLRAAE
ncbi:nuclear transport factor 2 family protein [Parafrankia sp. FMc2]|uniref:nuclear transport factor 2 family protein n=1 Tax=Parafrankia sp. FMc2 TaxID=3233196 RepID=UPI0034D65373